MSTIRKTVQFLWKLLRSDMLAKGVFVLGLCVLAFGYGIITFHWKIFPYTLVRDAVYAFEALASLEDDRLVPGLARLDAEASPRPLITQFSAAAGTEALLITGGPYQYMEQCPSLGCLAWVIDREGRVLHHWEVDPDILFAGIENAGFAGGITPKKIYPIGMALEPDGSLIVTFHARNTFPYQVGIAKISVDGEVLWKHFNFSHHWIDVDADGRIYVPSMKVIDAADFFENSLVEVDCTLGKMFYEGVRVYAPDGTTLREIWILESLAKSGYPGFFYGVKDGCDPVHINSVQVVKPEIARVLPGVDTGDILVSFRESSVTAILDGETGRVELLRAGQTAAQHSPQFLPDGTVVIFDNQGGQRSNGGSRIVRLDLVSGASETIYPRGEDSLLLPFISDDGGHISVSPDGKRLLISSKHQARSFEIDIETGEVLWMMEKSFDLKPYLEATNKSAKADRAYFNAYGTYYLNEKDFIRPKLIEQNDST